MNHYNKEVSRIKDDVYSNQWQIDTVIGLKNYMDINFSEKLNLTLFSKIRFVSKYHLLRLFKKYYGLTPNQYLMDKRVEKAKEYIKKGMSVSDACYEVGFESLSSFSSLFKRKTGISPSEYQKSNFR
ncbi:helix-turn-helix domain-containing protein [Flammeovirga yaeyamensis]|uniref:Helix-turn-helix domain-containing protein n=1 Tax=Flammeovirga yaeyamensis TaxID=367791 RepID=A0AAX1N5W3_9BACT|nr:AraC family transcriptional regulator [Flammeovirga yaeyamensis]MBB3701265.1 AraC-like DNA-binding protein [Flammeovirga yaeyamensis]NMF38265.1 helix-turn-helix transcriptional regulator [Flammeovirga yaeyamensis]QWG02676.1 helix-turn-helix domain-containing protein [Flammeovirga yaeyamensis]